jgi:glucokinase
LQAEAGDQAAAQIDAAYRLLFGRSATEPERIAAERLVAQYGLTALCRALLNSNEFLILP